MKKIILIIVIILLSYSYKTSTIKNKNTIKDSRNIEVLGNIKIKSIMLNSNIIEGTTLDKLNQNKVGHIKESSLNFNETIILAGHNDTVFKSLDLLKKEDVITLEIYGNKKDYIVFDNIIISDNDYTNFKKEKNKLILITCTNNLNERRIIIAYLKV